MESIRQFPRPVQWGLVAGAMLLIAAVTARSGWAGVVGGCLLIASGATAYFARRRPVPDQPWPWPPDFRAQAETMARPIDPTPKRLLPPPEQASLVAEVATAPDGLAELIANKPAAWPWAVFTSVLVQRRNGVGARLRRCVSGYQPNPGRRALTGHEYAATAHGVVAGVGDLVAQLEQFMLSPAFKGAFGDSPENADADAIVTIAHRLMDYHDGFLAHAETALQTPVQPDALVLVADMGAFALCPLIGYQQFIPTMCARIGEAQELLPYTNGGDTVALDDVNLAISLPDGLMENVVAQLKKFTDPGRN